MRTSIIISFLLLINVCVYGQVYHLKVSSTTSFRHDFFIETYDAIGTDQLEILGRHSFDECFNIQYDLNQMSWKSDYFVDGVTVIQQGIILKVNPTNAVLNINIKSNDSNGTEYHVLIDKTEDLTKDVIYVRSSISEDDKLYVSGWSTTDFTLDIKEK